MAQEARAFAPASIANLAIGYDIMGLAIHGPGDEVHVRLSEQSGVRITSITGTEKKLPLEAEKNTAGCTALKMLAEHPDVDIGIEMEIIKKMPFGSGMGSSAASAAAAAKAVNALLDGYYTDKELCRFAMQGERVASGGIHGDNVIPSLLGGIILIRQNEPLDLIQLPVPEDLHIMLIHPDLQILTKDARNLLSDHVSMKKMIRQTANASSFIAGLYSADLDLISRSLEDHVIEPQRAKLIPYFDALKKVAHESGAMNFTISGAGPSMFSFCRSESIAQQVGKKLNQFLDNEGVASTVYTSNINTFGTQILEVNNL